MIKFCSVIYNAGYGGNFFARVLSLSKETVPYLYQDIAKFSCTEIKNLQQMSVHERYDILKYQGLKTCIDWHTERLITPDVFYEQPTVNNFFEWSIIGNHGNTIADSCLDYIVQTIWIDLDLSLYQDWLNKSYKLLQNELDTLCCHPSWILTHEDLQKIEHTRKKLEKRPICNISMTDVLSSTDGFANQYTKACEFLNITAEIDLAIAFYQGWHDFRFRKVMNS